MSECPRQSRKAASPLPRLTGSGDARPAGLS